MLELDGVTYAHKGQARPYRFDLTAAPGAITAVMGPSGSGKSTLLDLIAGFLTPKGGTIALDGQDLVPLAPEDRPVSLLFQADSLFEHLSTAQNVALGLKPGTPRRVVDEKVAEALAEVGLSEQAGQRASTLSGGQKQRAALARTLLRARPILLLDEPFSALDDDTRMATRNLVRQLTEAHGWITVLVSHHADDVASLASRRYRLADGRLAIA